MEVVKNWKNSATESSQGILQEFCNKIKSVLLSCFHISMQACWQDMYISGTATFD